MLTYKGANKLNVNNLELALQGGGYFSSLETNSISLNQDGGTLKLADNATSLSHLHIDQNVSTAVPGKPEPKFGLFRRPNYRYFINNPD